MTTAQEAMERSLGKSLLAPKYFKTNALALLDLDLESIEKKILWMHKRKQVAKPKDHLEFDNHEHAFFRAHPELKAAYVGYFAQLAVAENAGAIAYCKLGRDLAPHNAILGKIFWEIGIDETFHFKAANNVVLDAGLQEACPDQEETASYVDASPIAFFFGSFLSEIIGFSRFAVIDRYIDRGSVTEYHPMIGLIKTWKKDEAVHLRMLGWIVGLLLKRKSRLMAKAYIRFFQLAVILTASLRDIAYHRTFIESLGIEEERYIVEFIEMALRLSEFALPCTLDYKRDDFYKLCVEMGQNYRKLDGLNSSEGSPINKTFTRIRLSMANIKLYGELWMMPLRKASREAWSQPA